MSDVAVGLKVTGDAKGAVAEVRLARQEVKALAGDTDAANQAIASGRKVTEDYAQALKKQYESLGQNTRAQKEFSDSLKQGEQSAAKATGAHENLTAAMFKGVGAVELVRRAWEKAVETFHEVVDVTGVAQQSQARLEAVLRANAGASGQTADSVNRLADEMARLANFDDTSIRNAATQLLVFKEVAGDAFERIIKLSADLASTGKGDLQTWVTLFAKVGTAPAETIGLLERSLGKLDLQTKVAIMSAAELGDKAKAMNIAMNVAAQSVGGAAVESYRGLTRQIEGTKKAWTDLEIAVGNKVFDANSKEASTLEQTLRKLRQFVEEDHWFEKLIVSLAGGTPYSVDVAHKAPSVQQQLEELRRLSSAAQGSNDPNAYLRDRGVDPAALQAQIAMLSARVSAAQAAAQDRYLMKPNDGPQPAAGAGSLFTPSGLNEMRQQQLQALQSLNDARYQLLEQAMQRELQLNQQRHQLGMVSEADYYAKLAELGTQQELNEVARIRRDIEIQRDLVGTAGSQLSIAKNSNDPQAVLAAQKALNAEKEKQRSLEVQLAGAEAKVGDAARSANAEQMKAAIDQVNRLEAIKREGEDRDTALQKQTDDMQLQLDLLGKTEEQAALITNQHKLDVALADEERKIRRQIIDLQRTTDGKDHQSELAELGKQLEDLPDKYKRAADAQASLISQTVGLRQQAAVYGDLGDRVGRFFQSVLSGGNVFRKLLQEAQNFAGEMLAIFGKQWTLQMAATATGNAALAAQAAQVGQGTAAGAASSMIGGAVNGIAGAAFAGGGAGGFTGAFSAGYTAQAAYLAGSAEMAPVMGTMAGEMGAAYAELIATLAEIPIYGWIAAAVVAVVAWISGNHKGGRKTGGSFMGNFDPSGAFIGNVPVPGTDNGRFFTPNQADPAARAATMSMSLGYFSQLRSLGGTTDGFTPGLGMDNDPNGTAQSRVSMSVMMGGRQVYNHRDLGVDDKEVGATIALEIQRGILAGLQNSHLDQAILNILGSVTAETATAPQIDAVMKLASAFKALGDQIAYLSADPLEQLKLSLSNMDKGVKDAQDTFRNALQGGDPAAILNAEQTLQTAIMNRYNSEIQMVRQLQQAIETLKQQAYEFSIAIAQRINSVGGSRDIAGMALSHAMTLQGQVGGSVNLPLQAQHIQQYVGAIDTWYQTRHDAIMKDAQAQQAAFSAWQQAQAVAYQARIAAVQSEIQLTQQWKGLLDQVTKAIDDMRLTSVNPLAAAGRYQLAQGDAAIARAAYTSATGIDRVTAAQRYVESLQRQLGLLGETYQRPSNEYQQGYNEIIKQLTEVQGGAKTESEKVLELQDQLVKLQNDANGIASMQFDASIAANAALDELNTEALGYYTWAEREGTRVNAALIAQNQAQLDAITGGQDVELFIAERQKEAVALLAEIRDAIKDAFKPGGSAANHTPAGGGDGGDGGGGGGGGGPPGGGDDATKIFVVHTQLSSSDIVKLAERGGPEFVRALRRQGVSV